MKLLSLNSHSLIEENWDKKMECIVRRIHMEQYDVIAFQEVNQKLEEHEVDQIHLEKYRYAVADKDTKIRSDNFAYQLVMRLQEYGDRYYWTYAFSHVGYGIFEEGVALLSREPILASDSIVVSEEANRTIPSTRRQVGITVCHQGERIKFYSVHFGWWNKEKEQFSKQWDRFIREVNNYNNDVIYVMGDFNNPAEVRGEGYDYIMKDGIWYDTWGLDKVQDEFVTMEGNIDGWKDDSSGKRIDLIIKNRPLRTGRINVVFNGINGAIVSDHFGIETMED